MPETFCGQECEIKRLTRSTSDVMNKSEAVGPALAPGYPGAYPIAGPYLARPRQLAQGRKCRAEV